MVGQSITQSVPGLSEGQLAAIVDGRAGGSAQREFQRRHDQRGQRVRTSHPKLGGLILAVTDDPQSTRAWREGAVGEAGVGKQLESLAQQGCHVLHDRRIPRTQTNIDHIVVSASGVYLVDAKNYSGRVEVRHHGGLLTQRTDTLHVGGRDRTPLAQKIHRQASVVRDLLEPLALPGVAVFEVLTFWRADWPLLGSDTTCDGVYVLRPRSTSKLIIRPGSLTAPETRLVAETLRDRLPPA